MRTYGIHNDYYDPDKNNKHNYMLDTSIFNALCYNEETLIKMQRVLEHEFQFFYTNVQIREMEGIRNVGDEVIKKSSSELDEKQSEFKRIVKRLKVKKSGHMAVMARRMCLADGSCHVISPDEEDFVKSIKLGNIKHTEDMIIAESIVSKGCILVTNDNKLRKKVKKTYPKAVINLNELLKIIDDME